MPLINGFMASRVVQIAAVDVGGGNDTLIAALLRAARHRV